MGEQAELGLVELADAIETVRLQLVAAQAAGRRVVAGQVLTFAVGKVSVELSGELKTTTGGSGGVKFWVVTADAKGEWARSASHKISVELTPQTVEGGPYLVSDDVDGLPAG